MDQVLVDIETLGVNQDAAIIRIDAVKFNFEGALGNEFHENIDWNSALIGRSVSGDTLKWWMRQPKEIQDKVCAPGEGIKKTLKEFGTWFRQERHDRAVWGDMFDISILENAFQQHWGATPWYFWNTRDFRTLMDFRDVNLGQIKNAGVKARAKLICDVWRRS